MGTLGLLHFKNVQEYEDKWITFFFWGVGGSSPK